MQNKNQTDIDITELEEHLVQENYGLVVSQALYFLSEGHSLDDMIQAGLIGLLKAIRTYDEEKSKFSTYASVCVKNQILKLKTKNKKSHVVFDSSLLAKTEKVKYYIKESFFDYVPDGLTQEQTFIIKLKLENYTSKEICDFLGCTKSVLANKLDDIFDRIREANL
tara:strand:+ start:3135 stop:3632 length:498 start_codon:yes stop_codon:yes gene_type:complete